MTSPSADLVTSEVADLIENWSEPSPESPKWGSYTFVQRGLTFWKRKNSTDLLCFMFKFGRRGARFVRTKPTKTSCDNRTELITHFAFCKNKTIF